MSPVYHFKYSPLSFLDFARLSPLDSLRSALPSSFPILRLTLPPAREGGMGQATLKAIFRCLGPSWGHVGPWGAHADHVEQYGGDVGARLSQPCRMRAPKFNPSWLGASSCKKLSSKLLQTAGCRLKRAALASPKQHSACK